MQKLCEKWENAIQIYKKEEEFQGHASNNCQTVIKLKVASNPDIKFGII